MKCLKCGAKVGVEIMPSIYKPSHTEAHCCICGWTFEIPTALLSKRLPLDKQITDLYHKI